MLTVVFMFCHLDGKKLLYTYRHIYVKIRIFIVDILNISSKNRRRSEARDSPTNFLLVIFQMIIGAPGFLNCQFPAIKLESPRYNTQFVNSIKRSIPFFRKKTLLTYTPSFLRTRISLHSAYIFLR